MEIALLKLDVFDLNRFFKCPGSGKKIDLRMLEVNSS